MIFEGLLPARLSCCEEVLRVGADCYPPLEL